MHAGTREVRHDGRILRNATAEKLGIKPGMSMAVLNAPANLEALLGELPDGVVTTRRLGGHRDLVVIFVTSRTSLPGFLP